VVGIFVKIKPFGFIAILDVKGSDSPGFLEQLAQSGNFG
jgi:hypothetical protein